MRVSHVWEEGEGKTGGIASEVCMDKGMCKSWTVESPRSPGSAKRQGKKRMGNYNIMCVECTFSLGRYSVPMCLQYY